MPASADPVNPRSGFAPRRVGLLGGSFNPAHAGHRHIGLIALARLDLDQVWWLVSPQNPLKPAQGMEGHAERIAGAARLARHPRIRVTGLEAALGTRFTLDTLRALRRCFRATRFVWLMGADNLIQIARWRDWPRIFHLAPIAVFARPTYCQRALAGVAARRFARYRLSASAAGILAERAAPAWVFLHTRPHPASATAIRATRAGTRRQGPGGTD